MEKLSIPVYVLQYNYLLHEVLTGPTNIIDFVLEKGLMSIYNQFKVGTPEIFQCKLASMATQNVHFSQHLAR